MEKRGFTLIEMLVVVAIIGLLISMVAVVNFGDAIESSVRQAAIELRVTLMKARSLALRTNRTYAVSFNVGTPAGSRVLRNFTEDDPAGFPGRHWYSIVAPCDREKTRDFCEMWLPPEYGRSVISGSTPEEKLNNMRSLVRELQVGGRKYLPRGVRFLALSDFDGGFGSTRFETASGSWARGERSMIYPIPWFGRVVNRGEYFRLFSWGFYEDPAVVNDDPDAHRGVLPGTVTGYWLTNSRAKSAFGPSKYPYFMSGGNWNIAEGDCMDASVNFGPDGSASWVHWYASKKNIDGSWYDDEGRCGWGSSFDNLIHGALMFTVCRDVDEGDDIYIKNAFERFTAERDALASIVPFARVRVDQRTGVSEVLPGLTGVPGDLHWTKQDGTIQMPADMSPLWNVAHPLCRVQQNQRIHDSNKDDSAVEYAKSYHLPEGEGFVHFRRASEETWGGDW